MTTEVEALVRAVVGNPFDVGLRSVLADFLMENPDQIFNALTYLSDDIDMACQVCGGKGGDLFLGGCYACDGSGQRKVRT